mmetsp:Transcript_2553/g.4326  ORF Transcript_2553/g.4326 Transcript_2553/m.4326 type:complete len:203 (+) Transcript_2553:470-1078(+)
MLLYEGEVGWHHRIEALLAEGENFIRTAIVEIIKENSSKPARLTAMFDREVLVGPLLETLIKAGIVLIAHILVCLMKVLDILFKEVSWGEVAAATEPPDAAIGLKIAIVEVHCRSHGVARVHHRTQAASKERNTLARRVALCTVCTTCGGRLQSLLRHTSVHNAEGTSRLLKNVAIAQHARDAAATALALPHVFAKCSAVKL